VDPAPRHRPSTALATVMELRERSIHSLKMCLDVPRIRGYDTVAFAAIPKSAAYNGILARHGNSGRLQRAFTMDGLGSIVSCQDASNKAVPWSHVLRGQKW
jgi:hypothetical protein